SLYSIKHKWWTHNTDEQEAPAKGGITCRQHRKRTNRRTGTDQRNAVGKMNLHETVAPAKAGTTSRRHRKRRLSRTGTDQRNAVGLMNPLETSAPVHA